MARLRDRLVGHGETWDHLLSSLQHQGAAVTLLFAGSAGVGKSFAAQALAQALLCERNSSGCGQCPSCLRMESGVHESFLRIEPDGNFIKMDQARDVIEFLQLANWGRARVVLIEQAHQLNPQAANALLKIFEEPPESTFLILTAPTPSSVLPTLRSRSRVVPFRPLTESELRQVQIAPDWALKAARGSVGRLRNLLDAAEVEVRGSSALVLQSLLTDKDFLFNPDWRDQVKERATFARYIAYWLGFLRDGLVVHARGGVQDLMNPDQKPLLTSLAKEPRSLIEAVIEKLLRLEADLTFNRDPQLMLEELFVFVKARR